jgi:hypothetical protein
MAIVLQDRQHPGEVLLAFASLVDRSVTSLRVAAAYTTARGCRRLLSLLEDKLGEDSWKAIPKQFITSFDFGITDPDAVELLAAVPNCSVFVADTGALARAALRPGVSFHPKLYVLDKGARRALMAGSANLTETAFTVNTEVVYTSEDEDPASVDGMWDALRAQAIPADGDLLTQYRERREALKKERANTVVERDERPPVIKIPTPGALPVFGEAIAGGDLDPSAFARFWIEAGAMSSGGSFNQLELPRGANRFFGYEFEDYDSPHEVIDYLTLTIAGRAWDDRKLTWHGNNMMERINLPTYKQGGFEYRGSAILFARHATGFELFVVAWDDPAAVSWREASADARRIYKLGQNSTRVCGLF